MKQNEITKEEYLKVLTQFMQLKNQAPPHVFFEGIEIELYEEDLKNPDCKTILDAPLTEPVKSILDNLNKEVSTYIEKSEVKKDDSGTNFYLTKEKIDVIGKFIGVSYTYQDWYFIIDLGKDEPYLFQSITIPLNFI